MIKSLGYKTDFSLVSFKGRLSQKQNYLLVESMYNPSYFWGNLIFYKEAPKKGDYSKWVSDFKKEHTNPSIYHMTFAWDSPEGEIGEIDEFLEAGFELEKGVVLSTDKIIKPTKYSEDIKVKALESDEDFRRCVQIQTACGDTDLSKDKLEEFYSRQMDIYREMISAGKGYFFGAYKNDILVGSLGVFRCEDLVRFQIVSTDPNYQRQGVCSTLVYEGAKFALENMGIEKLVMVADEEYHAAKIYESVGFKPTEKLVGLCWYDKDRA